MKYRIGSNTPTYLLSVLLLSGMGAQAVLAADLPPGDTSKSGTLPGSFAVTVDGAATYSIPFELPGGRNGTKPELGLTYHSDRGSGIPGVGWSIYGTSRIERCPLVPARLVGPNFNTTLDCLDGHELIRQQGGGYRLNPDTGIRVFSLEHGWRVDHPNGRKVNYDSDGRAFQDADRFGNLISYKWDEDGFLLEVGYDYTRFDQELDPEPYHRVVFDYEERQSAYSDTGTPSSDGVVIDRRLKQVTVLAPDNPTHLSFRCCG